jgi:hypothetical protein
MSSFIGSAGGMLSQQCEKTHSSYASTKDFHFERLDASFRQQQQQQ